MNTLFNDVLDKYVLCYLDDILIFSQSLEEHDKHVRDVLNRLRKYQFYCKLSKCEFFCTETTFLGHVITANGVAIDGDKVKAVK